MNYCLFVTIIAFLVLWTFIHSFYATRNRLFVESFLDSNHNIIVVYDRNKITMINHSGLVFFGFDTVQDFRASHSSISDLFLEDGNSYTKYTDGKNWIKKIENSDSKTIKVKMLSKEDNQHHYFHIKISKMRFSSQYLLSFNNISDIEKEKQEIKKQAEYDLLTKVYNRVKLNEVFTQVLYNANRYNHYFSITLLDIDLFKNINDTYGHAVGDKVLVELARLITISLGENDIFARWGGEEFIIISENSDLEATYQLATQLKRYIENFVFEKVGRVTCSFGVTEFKVGDTEHKILERVDKALYEAKANGRNQVVKK